MVEILGMAGSIAGPASLAIHLADSAMKLRRLCQNVCHAPKRLEAIVFDVETLSIAVQSIEDNRQRHLHLGLDGGVVERCLTMCQTGTERIIDIATILESSMNKNCILGWIKMTLKDAELNLLCNDLERAKSTMLLGYQLYTSEAQRHWTQLHGQTLSNALAPLDGTRQRPMLGKRAKAAATDKQRRSYRLGLQFVNCTWEFAASQAANGWNFRFLTYNIRPLDSEIFRLCRKGDVDSVRQLLKLGKASIFDVSPDCQSTLHHAVASKCEDSELCQLLLEGGADPNSLNLENETALDSFARFHACPFRLLDPPYDKIYRIFLDEYDIGIDLPCMATEESVMWWYMAAPATALSVVKAKSVAPYASLSLQHRLMNAMMLTPPWTTTDTFLAALGVDKLDSSHLLMEYKFGSTTTHFAAAAIGSRYDMVERGPTEKWHPITQQWISVLHAAITLGAD